jgi:hypothetical protein
MSTHTRRFFLGGALATGATYALARSAHAAPNRKPIYEQIQRRHDQTVALIQEWIRQPSIAAENRGVSEGCELTMRMLRDAGFQRVERMPTDGQPGILATLDAGARRSLGVYFMYDVKQADPNEWMSPPWEARLLDLPDLGGDHGSRCDQPERSASRFPRGAARHSRRGRQATGEPRAGRRG